MKQDILNINNENVGTIELSDAVFGVEVRSDVLTRVVNWQLAKRQAGTHKTKTRSEVKATGAKPWAQKGGGRARAGSKAISQFRGGGNAFGPVVRDHGHLGNEKVTIQSLEVVSCDADRGLIMVKGAVPGAKGGFVSITDSIKKSSPDNLPMPAGLVKKSKPAEVKVEAAAEVVVEADATDNKE